MANGDDTFRAARDALRGLRAAQRAAAGERARTPLQRALAEMPDLRCPRCGLVRVESRRWVLTPAGPVCRSCAVTEWVRASVVAKAVTVNGPRLRAMRARAGASSGRLAEACGWSQSYQCRIERSEAFELDEASYNVLRDALDALFVDLDAALLPSEG